jgi:hypothetical protein
MLYGDEVDDLLKLADLLQHPEKFGCTLDRGTNPEASRIIDAAVADILDLMDGEKTARKSELASGRRAGIGGSDGD